MTSAPVPSAAKRRFDFIVPIKLVLSLFIVFHITATIVLPNAGSIVGRVLDRYFVGYGNLFVFNRTWQFFSPGPMPNFYLEYEVERNGDPASEGYEESNRASMQTLKWPATNVNQFAGDYFPRIVAGMRFLAADDSNFEKYFIPYLCRQSPGAVALNVRSIVEETPNLERASDVLSFKDMQEQTKLPRRRYDCVASSGADHGSGEGGL
jgi:hypothetical protein